MDEQLIKRLKDLKHKHKFADSEWEKRGLNPSDPELCLKMETLFNDCADSLIDLVSRDQSGRLLKKELKAGLDRFNKMDYDTEEKEFICDNFYELSQILNVDFKDNLNNWLYGLGLNNFMKVISAFKRPEKVIETLSQECTKCYSKLETFILERRADIPDTSYDIVKCKACGEFNMIDKGSGIKSLRFGNYDWIEQLSKDEYTYEQAETRLEQIKFFRK